MSTITITPIGVVRNGIHEKPETWADICSEIHVRKELEEGLEGLEEFSHIVVVFAFYSSTSSLKVHPKGREDLPLVGVFATRAPVRPNPLGVSIVELIKRKGSTLTVKGLDAFDGTAVLDIKPHLSGISPERVAKWAEK